ncbi:MAG TPA: hypothetical protein VF041_04790 [Gemmatimonadaceae bacterium]
MKTTPRGTARHRFTIDGDQRSHHIDIRMGDAAEFAWFLRGRYRRRSG